MELLDDNSASQILTNGSKPWLCSFKPDVTIRKVAG